MYFNAVLLPFRSNFNYGSCPEDSHVQTVVDNSADSHCCGSPTSGKFMPFQDVDHGAIALSDHIEFH